MSTTTTGTDSRWYPALAWLLMPGPARVLVGGAYVTTLAIGRISAAGKPFTAPFRLRLAHPTLPHKDIVLLAVPDGEGRFSLALPGLEPTHWQVVAEGSRNDWRLARSRDWKKDGNLAIEADR